MLKNQFVVAFLMIGRVPHFWDDFGWNNLPKSNSNMYYCALGRMANLKTRRQARVKELAELKLQALVLA